MAFHVGQRVVCIDGSGLRRSYGEIGPETGAVYTVREVGDPPEWPRTCLLLVEIVNEPHNYTHGFCEGGFDARRFRPLVERKTSIEIFQRMLTPKSKSVKERA